MSTSKRSSLASGTKCVVFPSSKSVDLGHKINNPCFFHTTRSKTTGCQIHPSIGPFPHQSDLSFEQKCQKVISHTRYQMRYISLIEEHWSMSTSQKSRFMREFRRVPRMPVRSVSSLHSICDRSRICSWLAWAAPMRHVCQGDLFSLLQLILSVRWSSTLNSNVD